MALKNILILTTALLLAACSSYKNHQLIVEKNAESYNAIKLSVSLVGDDEIECNGEVRYNDVLLHKFTIKSHKMKKPEEFLINYSEFPDISLQLASDFVLDSILRLEISVRNRDKDFLRKEYLDLKPIIPPVMTGISVQTKDIAAKYPMNYRDEVYEAETYLNHENLEVDNYTLKKIATLSTLIKGDIKILSAVVPPDTKVPIYKGKSNLKVFVECDTFSFNPQLVLYPSPNNKYYEGPNLYQIAKKYYSGEKRILTSKKTVNNKFLLERNFDVKNLKGEYNLFMIICDASGVYFYYEIGAVIFDNIAPEFSEFNTGSYYFAGNALFEGKVYLDYTIPTKRNPYDVIFSGKVYGDVKSIAVDGKGINFYKNSDLLFSRKMYINNGYKDVRISIQDELGNSKNYDLPIIVSQ